MTGGPVSGKATPTVADEPGRDTQPNDPSAEAAPKSGGVPPSRPILPTLADDADPANAAAGKTVYDPDVPTGADELAARDPAAPASDTEPESSAPGSRPARPTVPDLDEALAKSPEAHRLGTTMNDAESPVAKAAKAHHLGTTMNDAESPVPAEEPAVDDDRVPLDPTEPPPAPKKKRRWLLYSLGSLFLLALAGPLLFYFFVWRYRPTAAQHIPAGTTIAIRADGRELYLYEPFRKNVLSSFSGSEAANSRSDRLKKHTGVDVRTDVREVIYATMTGESWVILIGGNFDRGRGSKRFVNGLKTFFEEEGVSGYTIEDDVLVGGGLRYAQAEDTTIIVANDAEILRAAMEPSDSWKDLALASSGAMSFVVDRGAFEAAGKQAPDKIPGLALLAAPDVVTHVTDACKHTQRASGFLKLGKEPVVTIDMVPTSDTSPETLLKNWEDVRTDAKALEPFLPSYDTGGFQAALLDAKLKERAKSVMVTVPWAKKDIDAGLERLGEKIRAVFAK